MDQDVTFISFIMPSKSKPTVLGS